RLWAGMPNTAGSYFCDPVLGDDPKGLYIAADVAGAIKDLLLPLAHTISPNRFELEWLSGRPVADLSGAVAAARTLGSGKFVCSTSVPGAANSLLTLETTTDATGTHGGKVCRVQRRDHVPHGTGDLLSALLLTPLSLGQAVGCVDAAIEASQGQDELQLIGNTSLWLNAAPVTEHSIEALS
ncbi:MAG: bifunctional hydroxymethylpyrimidine kinase/phosphomethylpyrimidine kinase, partial [Hyphomicrobiaceae bacterium]